MTDCTNCRNGDVGYELLHNMEESYAKCITDEHFVLLEDGVGLDSLIKYCPLSYGLKDDEIVIEVRLINGECIKTTYNNLLRLGDNNTLLFEDKEALYNIPASSVLYIKEIKK